MKASQRKKDPLSSKIGGHTDQERKQKREEVTHKILTGFRKNVGEVGAEDVAALNTIVKAQLRREGITVTPGDIMGTTRAIMSDTGADPSRAMKDLKKKK